MQDIILKPGMFLKTLANKAIRRGAIPGLSLSAFILDVLKNPACCVKQLVVTKSTVTQITSITTAVTLDQPAGEIITVSATIAAAAMSSFTFNNTYIKADSVILATVNDTTGSGLLAVQVDNIVAGSCTVSLGGVVANTGVVSIGFSIV